MKIEGMNMGTVLLSLVVTIHLAPLPAAAKTEAAKIGILPFTREGISAAFLAKFDSKLIKVWLDKFEEETLQVAIRKKMRQENLPLPRFVTLDRPKNEISFLEMESPNFEIDPGTKPRYLTVFDAFKGDQITDWIFFGHLKEDRLNNQLLLVIRLFNRSTYANHKGSSHEFVIPFHEITLTPGRSLGDVVHTVETGLSAFFDTVEWKKTPSQKEKPLVKKPPTADSNTPKNQAKTQPTTVIDALASKPPPKKPPNQESSGKKKLQPPVKTGKSAPNSPSPSIKSGSNPKNPTDKGANTENKPPSKTPNPADGLPTQSTKKVSNFFDSIEKEYRAQTPTTPPSSVKTKQEFPPSQKKLPDFDRSMTSFEPIYQTIKDQGFYCFVLNNKLHYNSSGKRVGLVNKNFFRKIHSEKKPAGLKSINIITSDSTVAGHQFYKSIWYPEIQIGNYKNAKKFIKRLNNKQYGGISSWRLPTIIEMLSIVSKRPNSTNGLHIPDIFRFTPGKGKKPVFNFITRSVPHKEPARSKEICRPTKKPLLVYSLKLFPNLNNNKEAVFFNLVCRSGESFFIPICDEN